MPMMIEVIGGWDYGDRVTITLVDGSHFTGSIVSLDPDRVALLQDTGIKVSIPNNLVVKAKNHIIDSEYQYCD